MSPTSTTAPTGDNVYAANRKIFPYAGAHWLYSFSRQYIDKAQGAVL